MRSPYITSQDAFQISYSTVNDRKPFSCVFFENFFLGSSALQEYSMVENPYSYSECIIRFFKGHLKAHSRFSLDLYVNINKAFLRWLSFKDFS